MSCFSPDVINPLSDYLFHSPPECKDDTTESLPTSLIQHVLCL